MPLLRQPQAGPLQLDKANSLAKGLSEVWVGSSAARTLIKGSTTSLSGSGSFGVGAAGKTVSTAATAVGAPTNGVLIGSADAIFPTNECTIAIFRRFRDTTLRNSAAFGYFNNFSRVLAHAPYGDGNIYFDFGDSTAGSGRVSTAFTKDTLPEVLVFTAGASVGREIWRRGTRIVANTAATATRPATVLTVSIGDAGGDGGNIGSDDSETYLFVVANRVWSPAEIASFSANPWQIFKLSRLLLPTAAVQLLAPSSDISAGTWTASSGGSLFAMLNEAVANDATFDVTSQASTFKVGLAAGANPGVTTGHIVRYRIVGSQTVSLMQGVTVIASWSQAPTIMTTFAQTLTGVQAAAITDYASLSIQFQAT